MHTKVEYLSCSEFELSEVRYEFQLSDMRYDYRNVVTERVSKTTNLQLYLI